MNEMCNDIELYNLFSNIRENISLLFSCELGRKEEIVKTVLVQRDGMITTRIGAKLILTVCGNNLCTTKFRY
jgi:hypothetical protein